MKAELDNIDIEILKMLTENARTPIKVIAQKVFVSSPTVAARIDAMERAGVIMGYTTKVNSSVLGNPVRAFINLEVSPDKKTELYNFIKKAPEVIECDHVTGEYSVIIKAIFVSTASLEHFITKLQNFGRTKTQIVMSMIAENNGFSLDLIEKE